MQKKKRRERIDEYRGLKVEALKALRHDMLAELFRHQDDRLRGMTFGGNTGGHKLRAKAFAYNNVRHEIARINTVLREKGVLK